ncbi:tRNA-splicing endonuclease subunit Sen34-like [Stegodyphus dumicola]|uniref:tRNA-splicing endonuclease subunit Sen34-like n=1 Tax=Stegodyphus dumicola TaxID=202533 RepID=UPI0015AC60D6|nr:tRNA-splicing endonuclease subunit Sen34-like [Stegodyphus dumicola]
MEGVECPWKNVDVESIRWRYPSSDTENLRYSVFRDLWEKDYYITGGSKFGGDFLAYEGDPLKYHALYIVICITNTTEFQATDIVTYGRLGHQVKKTVVLASLNEAGNIVYISLNWAPEIA